MVLVLGGYAWGRGGWCAAPGFQVKLRLARSKYLPAGLHAVEASYVSASSLGSFRAAIVRSIWSSQMPLANTPVVLNLLDGPVGVDPAFHIVWTWFRLMRRCSGSSAFGGSPVFLGCWISWHTGPPGHGPVHLLLTSAAQIGFVWDGEQQGWVRVVVRMKMSSVWRVRNCFLLGKARNEEVKSRFCGGRDGDGHFLGGLHLSSYSQC